MFPPRNKTFYKKYYHHSNETILWGKFVWKFNSWHMNTYIMFSYKDALMCNDLDCGMPIAFLKDGFQFLTTGQIRSWVK